MLDEETSLNLETELVDADEAISDYEDTVPTDFLDTEENVEEYLLEAIKSFTESDYEEDMRWDHPDANPGMFVDNGGIILRTEVDGEEIEYRVIIQRV